MARSVWWRSTALRRPPVRSRKRSSSSDAISDGLMRHGAGGRELDRERHAVEAPADLGDGREVGGRDGELGLGRSGPLDEQLHGVGRLDGVRVGVRAGKPQRAEGDDLLAVDREPLAAGGEEADVRARLDDLLREVARGVEQVLAVVEHEEQVLRPEVLDDALRQVHARAARHRERRRDDLGQGVGAVCCRELAEPGTVRVVGEHLRGDLHGEARLADAADTGERDHRRRTQRVGDLAELLVAADERRLAGRAGCRGTRRGSAAAGSPPRVPARATWNTRSGRARSRRWCSPRSSSVTSAGSRSRTSSSVACDTMTWPPCAAADTRAARFTAVPK